MTELLRNQFNIYFSTTQIEEYCLDGEEAAAAIDVTRVAPFSEHRHLSSGNAHLARRKGHSDQGE